MDEIARYVTADTLGYLSLEGMVEAVGSTPVSPLPIPATGAVAAAGAAGAAVAEKGRTALCTACFAGRYPVGLVPPERQGWERLPESRPGVIHTS